MKTFRKPLRLQQSKKPRGQAITTMVLIIALLFVLPIGLFCFDVGVAELAQQQLQAACDAAALSAAAALASQDNTDPTAAHTQAINCAFSIFERNMVAGVPLTGATAAATATDTPSAGHSSLFVQFIDPLMNLPVGMSDPRGKIVHITAAFGLQPNFLQFLGLPVVPVRVAGAGGVPSMDVVVCFDVSGSIDDQTMATFVNRQWTGSAATGKIAYAVCNTRPGATTGPMAQGRIFDLIGPVPTGTRVNAVYPQYLSDSQSGVSWPLTFSEAGGATRGLRGQNNTGSPPGNYPPGSSSVGDAYTYTDLVANIDGQATFGGTTYNGYAFPDVATLVEASRGNLENTAVFASSKANTGVPPSVSPRAGYQLAYFAAAYANLHPIQDAKSAVSDFLTIMNTNTDAHFGFITFSDFAGTSANGTYMDYNIDSSYPVAGQANFPIPNIPLTSAAGVTNYSTIQGAVPTLIATTSTNIGDAVNKAVQQLQSSSRPGSKKAIVLFTDGEPTAGEPLSSDPWANARLSAVAAKNAGIPIYTIGLAQNQQIIPSETALLNDTNSDPSSGGMAAIAGNGGQFFLVTNVSYLRETFEHLARLLVQLVH